MSLESIKKLSELTGRKRETIAARLVGMQPEPGRRRAKLYDSTKAIPIIYGIAADDGGKLKISSMEAGAELNIKKREQIELDMEIKRKERIPLEDVAEANNELIGEAAVILRSLEGKTLTASLLADVMEKFRALGGKLVEKKEAA